MADFGGGLFGCFSDCGVCIKTCFCPCMQFGENAEKAGAGSCILCCLCYGCGCILIPATIVRGKVQEKVGLANAGCISNCCVHWCCHPCALCQETRALKQVAGAPQEMEMSR